jgi:hypothetical protein
MVQQIMTGLSSAASEKKKFQLSLSVYLVYWNVMAATVHRTTALGDRPMSYESRCKI